MTKLYKWLMKRDEDVIIMVTHWNVIRWFTGEDVGNCEIRAMDLGRCGLKQDENVLND